MVEEKNISEIFLAEFISELISASKPAPETQESKEQLKFEQPELLSQPRKKVIEMLPEFISPIRTIELKQPSLNSRFKARTIESQKNRQKFIPSRKIQDVNMQTQIPSTLLQLDINEKPTAEKLNFLIKDPAVTEIECLGAEQQLLVKKAGTVQRTRVKLSIEEVYQLIAEFSQKTRIPVIEGTFKAALNNLILTAILSETLGPRFILQKKNPFQELVPSS